MSRKASAAVRFLAAVAVAAVVLVIVVLRVTGDDAPAGSQVAQAPPVSAPPGCAASGFRGAAQRNAETLRSLAWAPFGRTETGWEIYYPQIAREIGTACPPQSPGFAAAMSAWERDRRLAADGVMSASDFQLLKGEVQGRRPVVRLSADGICAAAATRLESARAEEGYGGKVVSLHPDALAAYRRMVAEARAQSPAIAADPQALKLFSGYRSPESDAARCLRDGNCDGVRRARCSPHRTGLALDLHVGQAPGFPPDSTADVNRLHMSRSPAYLWLLANARRHGFVNYPFEPWHWEWTGPAG